MLLIVLVICCFIFFFFKQKTAYEMRISDWSSDVCSSDLNSPVVGFEGSFRVKQHQFSEELQLSGKTFNDKLDYLVGAYYFSEGGTESEDVAFPGGLLQIVGDYRFKTKSYALFTHLNYRVSDLIGITLGGRYTKEDKTHVGNQRYQIGRATCRERV